MEEHKFHEQVFIGFFGMLLLILFIMGVGLSGESISITESPPPACDGVTCPEATSDCKVAGTCGPGGLCSAETDEPDGTACNDGDDGTIDDYCTSGVCAGYSPVAGECRAPDARLSHLTQQGCEGDLGCTWLPAMDASCTGNSDVPVDCSGTATDTSKTCDLNPVTDGSDECWAGCTSSGFLVCDLDVNTDGTAECPSNCHSEPAREQACVP